MKTFQGFRSVRQYVFTELARGTSTHAIIKVLEEQGYPHKQAQNLTFKYQDDYLKALGQ